MKALLASLDDDSDDDNDSLSARARVVSAYTKAKELPSNADDGSVQKAQGQPLVAESGEASDEEEEEDIVRPRGRLAAMMVETEANLDGDHEQPAERAKSIPGNMSTIFARHRK